MSHVCVGLRSFSSRLSQTYYDFSKKVGYFEAMHLIIRSRMWLFPGALGKVPRVKREVCLMFKYMICLT